MAPAPPSQAPPQPADAGERLAQLTQPGELMKAGILTEAEFQQQKARILDPSPRPVRVTRSMQYLRRSVTASLA